MISRRFAVVVTATVLPVAVLAALAHRGEDARADKVETAQNTVPKDPAESLENARNQARARLRSLEAITPQQWAQQQMDESEKPVWQRLSIAQKMAALAMMESGDIPPGPPAMQEPSAITQPLSVEQARARLKANLEELEKMTPEDWQVRRAKLRKGADAWKRLPPDKQQRVLHALSAQEEAVP